MTVEERIEATGIIPVIKIDNAEDAIPMAKALFEGGIKAAEITFRTDAAAESISRISKELPDMFVCAGTILSVKQAKLAVQSGAAAIISPGLNEKVVDWCLSGGIPVFPGCATPTEVERAMNLGLNTVKLFPAEVVGGVKMLKALDGPYSCYGMKFMPTGGISPSNVTEYLKLPNVIACGGSWLCPGKLMEEKNWDKIKSLAAEARKLADEANC